MKSSQRPCGRSESEHVRKFIEYAKLCVNEARIYPPNGRHRYLVALALYSKSITVAEATLVLISRGFSDEAFAMTRTLIDIFITMRYIANKDSDERAKCYVEFSAKNDQVWSEVIKLYWPEKAQPLDERTRRIAASFPSPHRWSGKSVKDMALEPDTIEVHPNTKEPFSHNFAYEAIFRWTSHYVHPTIGALRNHLVQAGKDNFVVRSGRGKDMSHLATFNTAAFLVNTMISFYRCMGEPQPDRLSKWAGALMTHVARRHK